MQAHMICLTLVVSPDRDLSWIPTRLTLGGLHALAFLEALREVLPFLQKEGTGNPQEYLPLQD